MSDFVSRAGEKLQFALDSFKISVDGLVAGDFGSSTGGFVDCLLKNGVRKVYSVDTSYGELAWKLRNDPKVVVFERTNAMHVTLPEKVDLVTIDTSWTKQSKILPNAMGCIKRGGFIISLVKPHYEAGRAKVDEQETNSILEKVKSEVGSLGGKIIDIVESPILGEKGKNKEFLAYIKLSNEGER